MTQRASGILLHISSLPGDYGMGSMGQEALNFIDFLHKAGQKYWQILPLCPTGLGNSPYMSVSVLAGNPMLIDLEELRDMGLLTQEELNTVRCHQLDYAAFDLVQRTHPVLLRLAYERADEELKQKVAAFVEEQCDWLPDYCLFMAIQRHFGGVELVKWPDKDLIRRKPAALEKFRKLLSDDIDCYAFCQYIFFHQWNKVHAYAKSKGISIIGDLPIYVSGNSADVWANPELFLVDENLQSTYVAGVPADSFCDDGQRWGNPLYDWKKHEETGFAWWCSRVRHSLDFYDVMRFDHFRGFDTYWAIPADSPSALTGEWRKGPGMRFLNALRKAVPQAEFIAEDLGELCESVYQLVEDSGLPGMRVLVDAFDPSGCSTFLPHCCPRNAVMYTSTHDTPTFVQWLFQMASPQSRDFAIRYLRLREDEGFGWGAVCGAWGSPCDLAVATFQDILGLGADARMNAPGTMGSHNWGWRVRREAVNDRVAENLRRITQTYGRLAPEPVVDEPSEPPVKPE